jgi:hypothetical protein
MSLSYGFFWFPYLFYGTAVFFGAKLCFKTTLKRVELSITVGKAHGKSKKGANPDKG